MEKEDTLLINCIGKLVCHKKKNKTGPCLTTFTKIDLKWIKDLNAISGTVKLL